MQKTILAHQDIEFQLLVDASWWYSDGRASKKKCFSLTLKFYWCGSRDCKKHKEVERSNVCFWRPVNIWPLFLFSSDHFIASPKPRLPRVARDREWLCDSSNLCEGEKALHKHKWDANLNEKNGRWHNYRSAISMSWCQLLFRCSVQIIYIKKSVEKEFKHPQDKIKTYLLVALVSYLPRRKKNQSVSPSITRAHNSSAFTPDQVNRASRWTHGLNYWVQKLRWPRSQLTVQQPRHTSSLCPLSNLNYSKWTAKRTAPHWGT